MKDIILFGASTLGKAAYEILKQQYNIIAFCDNDEKKWGTLFCSVYVISPEQLIKYHNVKIIIASIYYDSIAVQLSNIGIEDYDIFTYAVKSVSDENYNNSYANLSYSQDGEDMILKSLFEGKKEGVYVDIGAYNPVKFSNTFFFYQMGWNGINIEPSIGSKKIFDMLRPRDINLEFGISEREMELDYYIFDEPALNGFSENLSMTRNESSNYKLLKTKKVKVYPLNKILDEYSYKPIDFMSIDVEGFELSVLKSNNWKKYRPKFLLVEQLDFNFSKLEYDEIYKYLIENDYELFGRANRTIFYKNLLD